MSSCSYYTLHTHTQPRRGYSWGVRGLEWQRSRVHKGIQSDNIWCCHTKVNESAFPLAYVFMPLYSSKSCYMLHTGLSRIFRQIEKTLIWCISLKPLCNNNLCFCFVFFYMIQTWKTQRNYIWLDWYLLSVVYYHPHTISNTKQIANAAVVKSAESHLKAVLCLSTLTYLPL